MELKVLCNCGQKFKFDVEPVNGRMPFTVSCPTCGQDGTASANTLLAQAGLVPPSSSISLPPPQPAAVPPVSRPVPVPATATVSAPQNSTLHRYQPPATAAPAAKTPGRFNLGLGLVGAVLGAGLGAVVIVAIAYYAGIRIPLLGVLTGFLTSLGARLLGRGGNQTLGILSAVIAVGGVVGTLFFIYGGDFLSGDVFIMNLVSILVSAYVAYRVASR
jgi:hypothetical protein